MLSKSVSVRCSWLSVFAIVYTALGWAQTTLKASPLLDEEAAAYRAVFKVELERRGSNTRGVLMLRDAVRGTLLYPIDLAAHTRKELYLSVSLQDDGSGRRFRATRLEWRGADGERLVTPLTPPLQTHLPIVVVGDMTGGLERLNGHRVAYPSFIAVSSRDFRVPLKVYYRRPASVPDAWQALLELPLIVLVDGAGALSESQWRALQRWLVAGGTLIISVGSLGTTFDLVIPRDLRLPRIHPPNTAAGVAQFTSQANGWQPLMFDEAHRPILYRKQVGFGQLYLFMGNLEHPYWRNWSGLPSLFEQVIGYGARFPSEALSQHFRSAFEQGAPQVRFGRGGWRVAVLLFYCAGVWGLLAYLRRRRRLLRAFMPMTALAALGTVIALLLAPRAQSHEPSVFSQDFLSAVQETLQLGYLHATLGAGRHTLTMGAEAEVLQLFAKPHARVEVHFSSDSPTLHIDCFARTLMGVYFLRPVTGVPTLEAHRHGERLLLRNLSSQPLFRVQVFGQNTQYEQPQLIWQGGMLSAGGHARVKIDRPDRFAFFWVQAFYERTDAPATTLNGKPLQEVNAVYCFVP
ncbi:MAG: hypothetical protein ACK4UU_00685 [Fimbriimonadales bacterium]